MTCTECIGRLATADLMTIGDESGNAHFVANPDAEIAGHLTECETCARAAQLMVAGELALRQGLGAEAPSRTSGVVAETSWARLNRSRVRRWVAAGSVVATIAVMWLFSRFALPEIQRLVAPEPPLVTKTFSISCLSPQQAATLLQPYLPVPLNPRWQAEHFSVTPAGPGIRAVTVRAPQSTIDRVPDLLARFEKDPGAACRQ